MKGHEDYADVFRRLQRAGFVRIQIDGEIHRLDEVPKLSKGIRHEISIVVDRVELVDEEKAVLRKQSSWHFSRAVGLCLLRKTEAEKHPYDVSSVNMRCARLAGTTSDS